MIDLIDFNRLKDFFSLKNHTHSYTNLEDKPTIPTKTSDLQNDSGFLTSHQSLSNYYTKTESNNKYVAKTDLDTLSIAITYTDESTETVQVYVVKQ